MKDEVLSRKINRIILQLSNQLNVSLERASELFYETETCARLHDARYGLHLMSDRYIIHDLFYELQKRQ